VDRQKFSRGLTSSKGKGANERGELTETLKLELPRAHFFYAALPGSGSISGGFRSGFVFRTSSFSFFPLLGSEEYEARSISAPIARQR